MKKIILIFIIILIIALGLGGYFWFIGRDTAPSVPTTPNGSFPSTDDVTLPKTDTTVPKSPTTVNTEKPETPLEPTGGDMDNGGGTAVAQIPLYKKISNGPVADHPRLFGTVKNYTLLARFVEKESGRVYEYRPGAFSPVRLTITTVPRVQESYFSNTGTLVLVRYSDELNTLKNFLGKLAPISTTSPAEKQLTGSVITKNIRTIAPTSAISDGFVYTEELASGGIRVASGLFSEKGDRTLLTLPTNEWMLSSPLASTLYLQSAPSSGIFGNLYSQTIGSSAGSINSLRKVAGPVVGMTSLVSPNGKLAIYSLGRKDKISTTLVDTKTGTTREFPITTLPEKCVWDTAKPTRIFCAGPESFPLGKYPDDYYKGLVTFSDLLWEIDTETDASGIMFVPQKEAGVSLDITNLSISPDGNYLIFINKKDGALWGFDLQAYRKL